VRVSVLGLGYIGLPTAVMLAAKGIDVLGVDIDPGIVKKVNQGEIHFYEPNLSDMLATVSSSGRLTCTTEASEADVFLIAVPTPIGADRKADLSAVSSVVDTLIPVIHPGNLIILESTSPVGTTEDIANKLKSLRPDLIFPGSWSQKTEGQVSVAYCPERVLPGQILKELEGNDRIVGGLSANCGIRAKEFYSKFVDGQCFLTNARTAEMCKLSENAYRDVNIAFANELGAIAEELGINVWEMITLANRHPRVNILQPGPGVGGHCIAVDPWFLAQALPNETPLIQAARAVNDLRPKKVVEQVEKKIQEGERTPSDLSVACFGLTFKPNVDDLRESPALVVAEMFAVKGFKKLLIVDPYIDQLPDGPLVGQASLVSQDYALSHADLYVLLVDHTEFCSLEPGVFSNKLIVDTRGIWYR